MFVSGKVWKLKWHIDGTVKASLECSATFRQARMAGCWKILAPSAIQDPYMSLQDAHVFSCMCKNDLWWVKNYPDIATMQNIVYKDYPDIYHAL